jgi:glycosyltransferase involved in cell wall biosynthesis
MLAIVTTHPIQYQTPIWQALAADGRVPFEVWYLTRHGVEPSHDSEFGTEFRWDIDTLTGYPHRFLDVADGATPVAFWKCRLRERLRERLRASDAKALWVQGWQVMAYWQAIREAKAAGAEVWLRGESNDLAETWMGKRVVKRGALGWLFGQVDRFLAIGSANRRLYKNFGVDDAKLYSAPYAVDNDRFARQATQIRAKRADLRRAWGIPDNAFCILFCGKFITKKRPMDIIDAAVHLRSSGRLPAIHLLFAGSGELGKALRDACSVKFDAEAHGAESSIASCASALKPPASFVGFLNQTEISRAYVAADCLVLPSDHGETWGLVVNEALASGLPSIVSRACGCAEDLAGEEHSYPVGDIDHLANRILALRSGSTVAMKKIPAFSETVSVVVAAYDDTVRRKGI